MVHAYAIDGLKLLLVLHIVYAALADAALAHRFRLVARQPGRLLAVFQLDALL